MSERFEKEEYKEDADDKMLSKEKAAKLEENDFMKEEDTRINEALDSCKTLTETIRVPLQADLSKASVFEKNLDQIMLSPAYTPLGADQSRKTCPIHGERTGGERTGDLSAFIRIKTSAMWVEDQLLNGVLHLYKSRGNHEGFLYVHLVPCDYSPLNLTYAMAFAKLHPIGLVAWEQPVLAGEGFWIDLPFSIEQVGDVLRTKAKAGEDWCFKVTAKEAGAQPIEIVTSGTLRPYMEVLVIRGEKLRLRNAEKELADRKYSNSQKMVRQSAGRYCQEAESQPIQTFEAASSNKTHCYAALIECEIYCRGTRFCHYCSVVGGEQQYEPPKWVALQNCTIQGANGTDAGMIPGDVSVKYSVQTDITQLPEIPLETNNQAASNQSAWTRLCIEQTEESRILANRLDQVLESNLSGGESAVDLQAKYDIAKTKENATCSKARATVEAQKKAAADGAAVNAGSRTASSTPSPTASPTSSPTASPTPSPTSNHGDPTASPSAPPTSLYQGLMAKIRQSLLPEFQTQMRSTIDRRIKLQVAQRLREAIRSQYPAAYKTAKAKAGALWGTHLAAFKRHIKEALQTDLMPTILANTTKEVTADEKTKMEARLSSLAGAKATMAARIAVLQQQVQAHKKTLSNNDLSQSKKGQYMA